MKIFNKALSMILCVLISLSCVALPVSAKEKEEETTEFYYSLKYYTQQSDLYNVDNVLDWADDWLAEKNYSVSVKVAGLSAIKIDLSSVDAICDTIDTFKGLLNGTAMIILGPAIKDLAELELTSWKTGMQRGEQDITIVYELIELLYNNKEIIRKLCDGTLDTGVFNEVLKLEKLVGKDGISGTVKKMIIGLVYEKDSQAYNDAYEEYKDDIDAFIYGDLLNTYADKYLPGFRMDESSTVESLICVAFGLVTEKYIKPIISEISIDTKNSEYEALRALDGLVNLDGSTYDFSKIRFNSSLSFLSQVNGVVGEIFTQLIPGYKWQSGNYDKISENIEGAFKYLGRESGLIENADSLSFDEIVMEVIAILVKNAPLQGIGDGVTQCETLEDMARVALINLTGKLGLGTSYKTTDSYLLVLGDIAAHYLYNNFDITDTDGKTLVPGMGYDIFEVANFALNYLLFDKELGDFLGFSTKKSTDVFTKVDKLLDYFGETRSEGVSFDSSKFLLGDSKSKGLLDAIFALDIEYILDITAVPALKTAGNVSAIKFIYNSLRNLLNNWSGKDMVPEYTNGAFDNALTNENVALLIEELIETLDTRNTSFVKALALVGSLFFRGEPILLGQVSAHVRDTVYSGGVISPEATATLGGKALTQYRDFVVVCTDAKVGKATAVIKGMGLYRGTSAEISFNVSLGQIKNLKATVNGNILRLSWLPISGADKYTVVSSELNTSTTESCIEIPVVPGKEYTFTVKAVTADGTESAPSSITVKAESEKLKGLESENITDSSVVLLWKSVKGAQKYSVEVYDSTLKDWKQVAEPTQTKASITGLTSGNTYQYRVCAVFSGEIKGSYSDTLTVVIKPAKVKNLDIDSVTATSVELSWSKVKGAKGYEICRVEGYENVVIKKVTSTSCTLTGLNPAESYSFRVRAYVDGGVYGDYSSAVRTVTLPSKVTGIKTEKTSSSYIKLSWKKVSTADKYIVEVYKGGQWVKYKTTTAASVTVKGLSSATTYKFRIRAYNAEYKVYSEYSSTYSAKTRVAGVKNLKASAVSSSSVKLSWSKVKGAEGYVAYYSTDNKTWKKIDSTSKNYITKKSLKGKKTYYFRVRAYSRTNGKAIYGSYSSVLKVKTK